MMNDILKNPEPLFTARDGSYYFARWGRPIAPIVFGVDDESLIHLKEGIAQTVGITGHKLAETDPELGANFMWFFCRDWDELLEVPNLGDLFPDFEGLLKNLRSQDANQYRSFSFDKEGAIQLVVVLLRMDEALANMSIQTLATSETLRSLVIWGSDAFANQSPIAVLKENGICIVKPEFAALVRASYDPTLPAVANDASHALRLSARAQLLLQDLVDEK